MYFGIEDNNALLLLQCGPISPIGYLFVSEIVSISHIEWETERERNTRPVLDNYSSKQSIDLPAHVCMFAHVGTMSPWASDIV